MEAKLFEGMTPGTRLRYLEDNAVEVVPNFRYNRPLPPEELTEKESEFARLAVDLEAQQEEIRAQTQRLKEALKPLQTRYKELLAIMRTGQEERVETVYLVEDWENRKVATYNKDGEMIGTRNMRKGDQHTVFSINPAHPLPNLLTGTDNE